MRRFYPILLLPILVLCSCATTKVAQPVLTARALTYTSVDHHGAPLTLSGRLTIPTGSTPRGVMLIPHGTYTSSEEAPSGKSMYEERFFGRDYVLVMPDYIGYGVTKDSLHPYLCGELTAQNCVDMLLAVRDLLDSMQTPMLTDSITIVGYSQGAAVALWTHRLLDERYADRLPVKICFAGSGPYDVASEFDLSVRNNRTGMPVTIPMLTMGVNKVYDLRLQRSDLFTPATEKVYNKYVLGKKHGFIHVFFHTPNHRLSHWLTKAGRDKKQPATQRVYEGLLRASLVHYPVDAHPIGQEVICYPWRPKATTYILHSTNDNIVSFYNSEHLRRCWGELPNVTYDFGRYGSHIKSYYQRFIPFVCERLGVNPE